MLILWSYPWTTSSFFSLFSSLCRSSLTSHLPLSLFKNLDKDLRGPFLLSYKDWMQELEIACPQSIPCHPVP